MERVDSLVLFLILMESLWVSLHVIWWWKSACCILLLLCLDMFLVSLISPRPLSWRGVRFCQMLFQHLMRWSYGVFLSVYLYGGLHHWIFVCWTIPAFLGWSQLDHDVRFFSCVLEFGLPVFYWVSLHLCSWVRFVCNSFLVEFLCGFGIRVTVVS